MNLIYKECGKCFIIKQFCVSKLELSTLGNGVFMELLFAFGSFFIGLVINRVGKSTILCNFLFELLFAALNVKC